MERGLESIFGVRMMTQLLYRGQTYVPQQKDSSSKDQIELTYRREHYVSQRQKVEKELNKELCYRGINYFK
tara:strand:+ start:2192 stop:2404 length:213 start_codon:yes stop_codon:yes gene_type:complete